jgi:NADPH:quinone reductase-like Zn-dependent oxidoreductase
MSRTHRPMKSWQINQFGLDALHLVDSPQPQPGPGEVLVRWRAWSLNYRDLAILQGTYLPGLPLPFTPLSDAAGEIVAIGDGVTAWKPGDRAISHYVQSWQEGPATLENTRATLGGPLPGTLSELGILPEHGLVPLPAHLSFAEGATLPIAALTAWSALFNAGDLRPGATVVLEGTGGVSLFGLQLARAAGLRTIITSGRDEKLARARTMGADATLNYRATPDWARHVREFTQGYGADFVLDVGGPATIGEALQAVRMGGRIAFVGFLGGTALNIDALALIRSGATIHSLRVGSRTDFRQLLRSLELARLHPPIDRVFSFHEVPAAFAHLRQAAHFGKIVVQAEC